MWFLLKIILLWNKIFMLSTYWDLCQTTRVITRMLIYYLRLLVHRAFFFQKEGNPRSLDWLIYIPCWPSTKPEYFPAKETMTLMAKPCWFEFGSYPKLTRPTLIDWSYVARWVAHIHEFHHKHAHIQQLANWFWWPEARCPYFTASTLILLPISKNLPRSKVLVRMSTSWSWVQM